jgi:PadR family transcriptional regulator AphA
MAGRQSSEYAILGMLSLRPMSGYDIRKTVPESIRYFWSESYGHIYPALKRLEARKLVERPRGAQKGRAGRQVYALTQAGRRELQEWLT